MSGHADIIRRYLIAHSGTDSYKVDQRTLQPIPDSYMRRPPRPNTQAGRALAALDALVAENQQLREALDNALQFAEMVLAGDTYGCAAGPSNCLHGRASEQIGQLRAALDGTEDGPPRAENREATSANERAEASGSHGS